MTSNLAIARGASGFVPPVSLAFWRWLIAFLIFLPFVFPSIRKNFKHLINESPKLLILGLTGFTFCGAFPYISGLTTTVINMGIIYSASPIFIILLSVLIFKEKISKLQLVGTLFCLFGVVTVVVKGDLKNLINLSFTKGDLWIVAAMMSWAVYSVYLMHWKSKFDLITKFTLMALAGTICLAPMYYVEEKYFYITQFNRDFFIWVIAAAVFPGIIAFQMYAKLQKYLGASLTGLTVYMMPVYSAMYGYLLFSESIKGFHWLGGFFVLLGIILANRKLFKF